MGAIVVGLLLFAANLLIWKLLLDRLKDETRINAAGHKDIYRLIRAHNERIEDVEKAQSAQKPLTKAQSRFDNPRVMRATSWAQVRHEVDQHLAEEQRQTELKELNTDA